MPQNKQKANNTVKLFEMFSAMDLSKEERRQINHLTQLLNRQGITRVMLIGGFVRDLYLDKPRQPNSLIDIDLVAEGDVLQALPELMRVYPEANWTEQSNLRTIRGNLQNIKIDIASARREKYSYPGAFPTLLDLCTIEEDESRRDFTINTLRLPLPIPIEGDLKKLIIGSSQALADIAKKIIRVYHDKSFADDPLRVIRAARYSARLGFELEPHTRKLIDSAESGLKKISNHRVRTELELLLLEPDGIWQSAIALLIVWNFFKMLETPITFNLTKKEIENKLTQLSNRTIQPEILQQAKHFEVWQIRLLLTLSLAAQNNSFENIIGIIKWLGGCGNFIHELESLYNVNWTNFLNYQNTTKLILLFLIWGDLPENQELVKFMQSGYNYLPIIRYNDFDESFLENHDFKSIFKKLWLLKFRQPELGINTKADELAWIKNNEDQLNCDTTA